MAGDLNGFDTTTKGFTGHEHLNNVALIHMNGRVYDYNLGRFLSVDPFIQFPSNSQSLNPNSYLMNNPFAGTDPSGYVCDGSVAECVDSIGSGGGSDDIVDGDGNKIGTITVSDNGSIAITSATGASGRVLNNAALSIDSIPRDELGGISVTFAIPASDTEKVFLGRFGGFFGARSFEERSAACLEVNPDCGSIDDPEDVALQFESVMLVLAVSSAPAELLGVLAASGVRGTQAGTRLIRETVRNADSSGATGAVGIQKFDIAPRVLEQLKDPRLGSLAGRLGPDDLQRLANSPSASRFLDARTGNINVIQEVGGKLLRITTPRDTQRIISVGPIRPNQVTNRVDAGDFIPLK